MNLDEMTRIAELMTTHDLSEFRLESEDMRLCLKRGTHQVAAPLAMPAPVAAPLANTGTCPPAAAIAADAPAAELACIRSPIVGTFYSASAPDTPPFVKVGDRVEADTVVCIVEAMKVMNEIKAETSGIIRGVLVENATPVEFGQPLFEID